MPSDIVSNDDAFLLLGIDSPSDQQINRIQILRRGLETAIRSYCHWQITEEEFTVFLPYYLKPTAPTVGTANLSLSYGPSSGYSYVCRGRNRLQLPAPFVKEIASIYVDEGAIAGNGTSDFPVSSLLDPETDYYLEVESQKSGGVVFSKSGGVIRVGRSWPSTSGTVKCTFTSGFSDDDLAGDYNDLRFAILNDLTARWNAMNRTAVSGGSQPLRSEKLGEYSYTNMIVDGDFVSGTGGLSQNLQNVLMENGYVFLDVAC